MRTPSDCGLLLLCGGDGWRSGGSRRGWLLMAASPWSPVAVVVVAVAAVVRGRLAAAAVSGAISVSVSVSGVRCSSGTCLWSVDVVLPHAMRACAAARTLRVVVCFCLPSFLSFFLCFFVSFFLIVSWFK